MTTFFFQLPEKYYQKYARLISLMRDSSDSKRQWSQGPGVFIYWGSWKFRNLMNPTKIIITSSQTYTGSASICSLYNNGNRYCGTHLGDTNLATVFIPICGEFNTRNSPRFFMRVGHETAGASIGKKHFFSLNRHRQTYQNNEQSRQKLGTFLEKWITLKIKDSENVH